MRTSITCLVVLVAAMPASARILNVPADYPTIQAGIDASVNGDTVLVAPGEYDENPIIQDKNILLTSAEGPTNTRINGQVKIYGLSVDTTCVLRGFRIDGQGYDQWLDNLVRIQYGSPIIWGNIIESNINYYWGAGVMLDSSMAIIRGNIIRDNWSWQMGAGIAASWRSGIKEGNVVSGNHTGYLPEWGDAAGIQAGGVIRYNLIIDNAAARIIYYATGGGLHTSGAAQVYNNTIVGNIASGQGGHGKGGGIYFSARGPGWNGFFKNNIVAFNPRGGGVWADIDDSAYFVWDYNLVFGNDTADYIGIEPGPHDVHNDPLFVDRFSGDYRLLSNSPCIDVGDPTMPLDPDSTRADIGAYYFDQSVGIHDDGTPSGPYDFSLRQNYPNPFNGQTVISYYLDKQSTVSLFIFSITGHLVLALVNKEIQEAGEHKYIWEGRDANGKAVSTGIYFYELYVNASRESKAMIMIK